jgi:hypothetical protein
MTENRSKLGSGYFLGFIFFALAALLWLRGLGKLILPVLLLGAIAYGVCRFIKLVREPVD